MPSSSPETNNDDPQDKDYEIGSSSSVDSLQHSESARSESSESKAISKCCSIKFRISDDFNPAKNDISMSEKIKVYSTDLKYQAIFLSYLILQASKDKLKKTIRCKFCDDDIFNKNFTRHLQRKHREKEEINNIFQYPKGSKERRHALSLLVNEASFDLYIRGIVRPNRKCIRERDKVSTQFYPCAYCKGIFVKQYLKRHVKTCIGQKKSSIADNTNKNSCLSTSQTLVACAMDPTTVISKLRIKEQVSIF